MTPEDLLAVSREQAFEALPEWRVLTALLEANLAAHGDRQRWFAHLTALPPLTTRHVEIGSTITVGHTDECSNAERQQLLTHLMGLQPWRKGPFSLFGVVIDTEWRSDWKWDRALPHIAPLSGRRVLDVGCGNGYYGWRMCAAGARMVVGVDPTLVYLMQHLAVLRYVAPTRPPLNNIVLPVRLEDLPAATAAFDTVFSMGVLYHRKDPVAHLRALWDQLRPGGELVLETLIVTEGPTLVPAARYARMRNVWQIPTSTDLIGWISAAGFDGIRTVDVTPTTIAEQRSTAWMPLQSLAQALDPANRSRTIEGLPAPVRSIVVAVK